jgi:translation elongation factor EF-Tu-like GTPase
VAGSVRVGEEYEFRGVRARCDGIEIGRRLLREATEGARVGVLLAATFPDR